MVYWLNKNCEIDLFFCEVDIGRVWLYFIFFIWFIEWFYYKYKNRDKLSFYLYVFYYVYIEF